MSSILDYFNSTNGVTGKSNEQESASTPTHGQYGIDSAPPSNGDVYTGETMFECDFTPIDEVDNLLNDCNEFLSQSKSELVIIPFSPFSRVRNWRMKRRDNKLFEVYDLLIPRIKNSEKSLRQLIGEIVEKKNALRLQGRHLIARLNSCIKFNRDMSEQISIPEEDFRNTIKQLSDQSAIVKSMMSFNQEVLRLKNVESISKGKTFISWSSRTAMTKPMSDAELAQDSDHPTLTMYLGSLRELREKCVKHLNHLLEEKEAHMSNHYNCETALQKLAAFLKKDHPGDYSDNIDEIFDHSLCTDCLCCYSLTNECMNHLTALQEQVQCANKRLQDLVEIRENINEIADQMGFQHSGTSEDMDHHDHFGSPTSETSSQSSSFSPNADAAQKKNGFKDSNTQAAVVYDDSSDEDPSAYKDIQ